MKFSKTKSSNQNMDSDDSSSDSLQHLPGDFYNSEEDIDDDPIPREDAAFVLWSIENQRQQEILRARKASTFNLEKSGLERRHSSLKTKPSDLSNRKLLRKQSRLSIAVEADAT